jgi:hypothetical protein
MSFTGTIQNGQVILTNPVSLPEGTKVVLSLEIEDTPDESIDWLTEVDRLARPRQWAEGYARDLDKHLAATHRK